MKYIVEYQPIYCKREDKWIGQFANFETIDAAIDYVLERFDDLVKFFDDEDEGEIDTDILAKTILNKYRIVQRFSLEREV